MPGSDTDRNCLACPVPVNPFRFEDLNCTTWLAGYSPINATCEPGTYSEHSVSTSCDLVHIRTSSPGYNISGRLDFPRHGGGGGASADLTISISGPSNKPTTSATFDLYRGNAELWVSSTGVAAHAHGKLAVAAAGDGFLGSLRLRAGAGPGQTRYQGSLDLLAAGGVAAELHTDDGRVSTRIQLGPAGAPGVNYTVQFVGWNISAARCDLAAIAGRLAGFNLTAYNAAPDNVRVISCITTSLLAYATAAPLISVALASPSVGAVPDRAALERAAGAVFHLERTVSTTAALSRFFFDVKELPPLDRAAQLPKGARRLLQDDDDDGDDDDDDDNEESNEPGPTPPPPPLIAPPPPNLFDNFPPKLNLPGGGTVGIGAKGVDLNVPLSGGWNFEGTGRYTPPVFGQKQSWGFTLSFSHSW